MSQGGIDLQGLDALRHALEAIGETFQDEAKSAVQAAAQRCYQEAATIYGQHVGPGVTWTEGGVTTRRHLKDDLSIKAEGTDGLKWVVKNKAPHAHLFEYGTQMRKTGRMPAFHAISKAAARAREAMYRQLEAVAGKPRTI